MAENGPGGHDPRYKKRTKKRRFLKEAAFFATNT